MQNDIDKSIEEKKNEHDSAELSVSNVNLSNISRIDEKERNLVGSAFGVV